MIYARDSFEILERRFAKGDMLELTEWWQDRLRNSVRELNAPSIDAFLASMSQSNASPPPKAKAPKQSSGRRGKSGAAS